MVWSLRSVEALSTTATRRTRALKQSRIVDVFAAARRGRRPRPKRPSSPKVKVITKVAKVKMVLRGLNGADLMADEPPLPPTPVEKAVVMPLPKVVEVMEVVATAVPEAESELVFNPFTCNETMCSCWGDCSIPVGNVCTLCSATKYSGFEKHTLLDEEPLPKVDAKQQQPVKAPPKPKPIKPSSKGPKKPPKPKQVDAKKQQPVNAPPKPKPVKPPPKPKPVKPPPKPKAIKKLKLPKPLPRPTTPTTPAERGRKLTAVVDPIPLDWDCQPDLDALFPVGFFTPDDVDNLFAGF